MGAELHAHARNCADLVQRATDHLLFVDVQEGEPTSDQLTNIIEYLGDDKIGTVVEGASSHTDALRKFKQNSNVFKRPVVVDWSNGRAGTQLFV